MFDTVPEIIAEINHLNGLLGKPSIKSIHTKTVGLKRIATLQAEVDKLNIASHSKAKKVKKPASEGGERRSALNFPPKDWKKQPKQNTVRADVLAMLKHGATLADIEALILKVTKKTPQDTAPYRAYKVVRHMNTKFGYGVKHDPKTGIIKVYG